MKAEIQQEALARATQGQSFSNYPQIYKGFMERGLAESEILPRENIFTYGAWRAKGRQVRKGEKGVKIISFIPVTRKNRETGETENAGKRPRSVSVFHVSQTDPAGK